MYASSMMKKLDTTNKTAHYSGPAWVWAHVQELAKLDPNGRSGSQIVVDALIDRPEFAEIIAQHANDAADKAGK